MPSMRALASTVGLTSFTHDEEHERDPERDLRPDAEAEPEREDRRQHDPRQRINHLDVGIEDRRHQRLLREPEADQDSGNRADDEGEHGFDERDPQMLPDRALGEPFDDARRDIRWSREKERREKLHAADGHGGEELPEQHRHERDEKLEREEFGARHEKEPPRSSSAQADDPVINDIGNAARSLTRRIVRDDWLPRLRGA